MIEFAPTPTRCCTISGRRSARTHRASSRPSAARTQDEIVAARRHADAAAPAAPARRRWRRPPDVLRARRTRAGRAPNEDEIEFSWVRQTARRVGTVVHEALERFGARQTARASTNCRACARGSSRGCRRWASKPQRRAGGRRARVDRRCARRSRTNAGAGCSIQRHREAQSELALSGVRGAQIVNAVIDRTFVDADGTRWVVDFKTSPHEGGDLDDFPRRRKRSVTRRSSRATRTWRAQLGPEPVRAGLYFPLLAAWREVDVDD